MSHFYAEGWATLLSPFPIHDGVSRHRYKPTGDHSRQASEHKDHCVLPGRQPYGLSLMHTQGQRSMCVANVLGSKATKPTWGFDSDGNLNRVEDRGSSLLLSEWLCKAHG